MIRFGKDEPVIKSKGIHYYREEDRDIKLPKVAVGVYSRHLYHDIVSKFPCNEIGYVKNANLEKPLCIMKYKDSEILLFMAGVSAPHIAGDLEEIAYHGVDTFIIFGNCGVLDKTIPDCGIIIPNLAYREEGTSYHYVEEGDTIEVSDKYKDLFVEILNEYNFDYREGPVWTTDAFYRETRDKVNYFKEKGCLCVDMEVSAIAAICKYKKLDYFTFFYAGDNLDSVEWEERSLSGKVSFDKKQEVTILALELTNRINKKK